MQEEYNSAQEAFESLNIDKKCSKLLVRRRLKELHKVLQRGRTDIYERYIADVSSPCENEGPLVRRFRRNMVLQMMEKETPDAWFGPYGRKGFDLAGHDANHVLFQTFNNNRTIMNDLFEKSVRAACSGDKVIFFSDVYTHYAKKHDILMECVREYNGPPIRSFEKKYPALDCQRAWYPPEDIKVLNTGYNMLYRGKLSGIIVG